MCGRNDRMLEIARVVRDWHEVKTIAKESERMRKRSVYIRRDDISIIIVILPLKAVDGEDDSILKEIKSHT